MKRNAVIFIKGISDRFLPALFWVLVIFGFDSPYVAISTIIAAAIHELGHLTAILFVGGCSSLPEGRLSGFRIKLFGSGYRETIIILASGPLFNLLAFGACVPFLSLSGYVLVFAALNLATALSNLVPVRGYDGYGIIEEFLLMNERSTSKLQMLSFLLSAAFVFVSLYMIARFASGYWVFGVFFSLLLGQIRLSLEKREKNTRKIT